MFSGARHPAADGQKRLDGQLDEPTKDAVPSSRPFIESQRLPAKPRVGKGAYGADLVVITDT